MEREKSRGRREGGMERESRWDGRGGRKKGDVHLEISEADLDSSSKDSEAHWAWESIICHQRCRPHELIPPVPHDQKLFHQCGGGRPRVEDGDGDVSRPVVDPNQMIDLS